MCRSSASAETRAAVDSDDQVSAIRLQLAYFLGYPPNIRKLDEYVTLIPGASECWVLMRRICTSAYVKQCWHWAEKRSDLESLCLKESMDEAGTLLRWVNGDSQLANSLTGSNEPHQCSVFCSCNRHWMNVGKWFMILNGFRVEHEDRKAWKNPTRVHLDIECLIFADLFEFDSGRNNRSQYYRSSTFKFRSEKTPSFCGGAWPIWASHILYH